MSELFKPFFEWQLAQIQATKRQKRIDLAFKDILKRENVNGYKRNKKRSIYD